MAAHAKGSRRVGEDFVNDIWAQNRRLPETHCVWQDKRGGWRVCRPDEGIPSAYGESFQTAKGAVDNWILEFPEEHDDAQQQTQTG